MDALRVLVRLLPGAEGLPLPAYQDAVRELDSLRKRNQEQAAQIDRLQGENRTLASDLRSQQNEVARLRTLSAGRARP